MLEIVRYAFGNLGPFLFALKTERVVNGAVSCSENGIGSAKILFLADIDFETAFVSGKGVFFTDFFVFKNLLFPLVFLLLTLKNVNRIEAYALCGGDDLFLGDRTYLFDEFRRSDKLAVEKA